MSTVTQTGEPPASAAAGGTLLEVDALRIQYGGVVAIDDISFKIPRGSIVGLIGPNGAGKTSLVDGLRARTAPSRGHVRFDGVDVTGHSAHRLARRGHDAHLPVGRAVRRPQRRGEPAGRRRAAVAAGGRWGRCSPRSRGPAPRLSPGPPRPSRSPTSSSAQPQELSHGQRKLVGVARALACRPSLLLLDEPAAGLDTDETALLGKRLRELPQRGITLLLIDHDMSLVLEVCDHILVIDFGKLIAEGTPAEIRTNQRVIDAYLGRQGGHGKDERRPCSERDTADRRRKLLAASRQHHACAGAAASLTAGYFGIPAVREVSLQVGGRRGGRAARSQRCRQDHDAVDGRRPAEADRAARCCSTATPIGGRAPERLARRRPDAGSRGPGAVLRSDRAGEPAAGQARRQHGGGRDHRDAAGAGEVPRSQGRRAVGRRAADADARARPDVAGPGC